MKKQKKLNEKSVSVSSSDAKMLGVISCFNIVHAKQLLKILRDYAVLKTFDDNRGVVVDMTDEEILGERDEWDS